MSNALSKDDSAKNRCKQFAVFLQKPFLLVDQSEFISGWGAAFINITVTYPIYKIIFRQPTLECKSFRFTMIPSYSKVSKRKCFTFFKTTIDINENFYAKTDRRDGFMELYRGVTPILVRNGPSNAMFFVLREEAAERLSQHSDPMTQTVQEFISGAIIFAVTSSIFSPFNVVKVAMQITM